MKNNIKLGFSNKDGQVSIVFSKGGPREGAGRKGFGETKKISLTLPNETWGKIENHCSENNASRSEAIREMIEYYFSNHKGDR
ncbi:ribbon-helix-helix domain-containing protein [Paenibacillus alkalitolerans]|uniref:ribbon-helix-helix domain-containing protein n=1 Tax=Paenibacillus alkalitolerans TaxID=2799335 RepID=UPI001F450813|nr:ribbon-helix-helix domain-containing protein [Paenibacillus alkalitolerans]